MQIVKMIFDGCYAIFSYKVNLFGFNVSLLNVFAFGVLASLCIFIVKRLLE